jgi:hypothetical protein
MTSIQLSKYQDDGAGVSFDVLLGDLECYPDIPTCVQYLYNKLFCTKQYDVFKMRCFYISRDLIMWKDENNPTPPNFLLFQEGWHRFLALQAFL